MNLVKSLNQIQRETSFDAGECMNSNPVKFVLKKNAIRFCVIAARRVTFLMLPKCEGRTE